MTIEMYNYDVFPKVVLAGEENLITIKALGWHAGFEAGKSYKLCISGMEDGETDMYPDWAFYREVQVVADEDDSLRFPFTFPTEQEYLIKFERISGQDPVKVYVYAVNEDMRGRYPYRGDLHVHSRRSDGKESPAIVCANYRAAGYDFMAITDHRRYYPSLEAMQAFEGVAPDFCLVPGEEVHVPLTDIHIINFGSHFSINGLVDGSINQEERGDDPKYRSDNGACPPVLSRDEYERMIRERAAKGKWFGSEQADISYAVCEWVYDRIREGGGLAIFCHPCWRRRLTYQVPTKFIEKMLDEHPFDAYEVLGGENYYEQDGLQTAWYYEELAKGHRFPIVGSTDTHGSTEHNRNALICSTIVFAPANTRESLIQSVRESYSVAVDTISKEFRLVGSLRLQKYACFLMENFYPLHDRACAIEGEYLRQYVTGAESAKERLDLIGGDVSRMIRKYCALG